jgi:glycine/D-amino acid oxidase-like deaminating enzyme
MANINEIGELFTSDVLIVGGGISGLATAIKVKQLEPELDILIVEKGYAGFSGQATRAGHGYRVNTKGTPIEKTAEFLVTAHTPYMNDQELLLKYLERMTESAQFMLDCGVELGQNADGSLWTTDMGNKLYGMSGIDITVCEKLRQHALKIGIRILSQIGRAHV